MSTLYLKTSQHIPMYEFFCLDGQLWQKTGIAGDYIIADAVDWEDGLPEVDLDLDLITDHEISVGY